MALLRVAEAAKELGVKDDTVRAWMAQRKLAFVKLGYAVRIKPEEVNRLIAEGTVPAAQKRRDR
jgi:excisionase family DNA binding protein